MFEQGHVEVELTPEQHQTVGILNERNRVRNDSHWILDGLLQNASRLVREGRREDADIIRSYVRHLRNITA